ncbi:MAG: serine hydrolase [Gemmatimonadaceae bacterium]
MRHLLGSFAALAGIALAQGCVRQHARGDIVVTGLAQQVRARIDAVPGAFVEVAFVDLGNRADTLYLHADSAVHAASTMKLPVMMRLYHEAETGKLNLDGRIKLVNQFASIVDGSRYALDPKVDGDTAIYATVGDSITVRDLIRHMITRSSNLATNTLIALANPDSVNAMMRAFGATHMRVLRGVEDQKAFDGGLNNMATARDLATLLTVLERGHAAGAAATAEMRGVLLAQEFNEKIPAGLPAGVRVAHKTGDITGIAHDAAIVYPPGRAPYVLVVLTKGIPDEKVADAMIADISRMAYAHATAGH